MTRPKEAVYKAVVILPAGGYKHYDYVKRVYASGEGYYLLTLTDGRNVHVPIQYTIIEELEAKP